MKLAIMQPYYLPYLGYFALIKHSDHFILFDTPQFIRHGWIERNRILKPQNGWQYIKVPLQKHSREIPIINIKINNSISWKDKIIAQLSHYKKNAPYYNDTISLLVEIFKLHTESIVELDKYALELICCYLGIPFKFSIYSNLTLNIRSVNKPDEWALEISKAMFADTYINPPGGEHFFDREKYKSEQIDLKILELKPPLYDQKRETFEPNLSIIDVLMFNSPIEINQMLNNYVLR